MREHPEPAGPWGAAWNATSDDPYGLPRFNGEEALTDWADHSEIALRTVRVFTRGSVTATVIAHPGVWDLIVSDGRGTVDFFALDSSEIAARLTEIGSFTS